MYLFLFRRVIYQTELPPEEIVRRLKYLAEPAQPFFSRLFKQPGDKFYEGWINGQEFMIRKIGRSRSDTVVEVRGNILKEENGVTVKIFMHFPFLYYLVLIMALFIFVLQGRYWVPSIISGSPGPEFFLPLFFFATAYILFLARFIPETNSLKEMFRQLLDAKES